MPYACSGVASRKFGGEGKNFDFRRATVFISGYRLSKRKMTRYANNFGGHGPLDPPVYAYGCMESFEFVIVALITQHIIGFVKSLSLV